ncbi:MAG: glutamate synthase large subunit [Spirochaetales bacterium]|nr:glutamate synthase large subunit [Spirochaetales bacterium]
MAFKKRPGKTGLYDPQFEKENCGVGFVAHLKGSRSNQIIQDAKHILINMTHRGAVGSEKNTGDGAGILTAMPYELLEKSAEKTIGKSLPERGRYAAGIVFLPQEKNRRSACKKAFAAIIEEQGQGLLGWRPVPRDNSMIGPTAKVSEPVMEQVFIRADPALDSEEFDRKLYIIRKYATHVLRNSEHDPDSFFYICSLSTKIMVYKGMLMPEQLVPYFKDLSDPDYKSHLAMVHSRFSTNTFPSWDRAQPLRFMSHNGEINTLRGNVNKMLSRQGKLESELLGSDLEKVFPVIEPDLSDSGAFDNTLELLYLAGRSMPESVMMMVPEAWQNHNTMSDTKKAFYEFNSCKMDPWDGPASISFTDGTVIGAVLDRNGLRPSRYYVTDDDRVIMASEVGVLSVPPQNVVVTGRLEPGKMFLVDFQEGRIVGDEELKEKIASQHPYRTWLNNYRMEIEDLDPKQEPHGFFPESLDERLLLFGYSIEHLNIILKPMVDASKEPLGSMGNDTPLAVLSERPKLMYDYFKQLFAQVTNPPIDSIREKIIMSLESFIGPEGNLLEVNKHHCHRLHVPMPILTNEEMSAIKRMDHKGWKTRVLDICYPVSMGDDGLEETLERLGREALEAIDEGYSLIVLSDRQADRSHVPVSALMACGAVHHYLVRQEKRTQVGILVESGEPREVHHYCMLTGYGADAINPYLAFEAMWKLHRADIISSEISDEAIVKRYKTAVAYGMRKVFGKMGISTIDSYKGAQIFEAIGLGTAVVDRCFAGTPSRIGGADFSVLAREGLMRHTYAYAKTNRPIGGEIVNNGEYQYRRSGEKHMWDPESIANLQVAARQNDRQAFKRFCDIQDQRSKNQATLRGLLCFKQGTPVPLDEVEPVSEITRRFVTGAMSYGSISLEAHETLAVAMNRLGGKSNTGEGGEDPSRFKPLPNGDSKRSAIKQVASGRFGVTIEYLTNSDEIQIKMAQGAKPGEGGELPGHKVFPQIAKTRYSTPGVGLISPPPHHDIYSIEDLAQLIFDLKNANPRARISVKLVSEVGVGTIAAGVAKGHADHILVSGHDGGTGASPYTGIKNAGLPWELGVAETHQTLVLNDLRSRVVLQTDGQIKTPRDVVISALLGAEECGFSTSALITMGCIMMRKCQLNTCPVGIATQDERLRAKFKGKPEDVVNFFTMLAEGVRELMAQLGFRTYNEMIGRVDILEPDPDVRNWKSGGIDLSGLLTPALKPAKDTQVFCCIGQDHNLDVVLDKSLIRDCRDAIDKGIPVRFDLPVKNTDRAVGTMLSHEIAKVHGQQGLQDDTIHLKFGGSAGQSFGAFLSKGVTLELEGDANDYVGKGLSGGTVIVYPPKNVPFAAEENIIIGNVAFYGATSGYAFIEGRGAERFCVRNSGAKVVIEGVGDHGCEYMTGGRVVILGQTGRNFAAGMSGGIAYLWDPKREIDEKCNYDLVDLEEVLPEDEKEIKELIQLHKQHTGSVVASYVLKTWKERRSEFVKVMPRDYKQVLLAAAAQEQQKEAVHG